MPTEPAPPLLDIPAAKKSLVLANVRPKQTSAPIHELELLFSSPVAPPTHRQSTSDHDHDVNPPVPQTGEAEDEYTLSAYGDISLSEVIVPPLPPPTHLSPTSPLQSRFPQPRLRLKVQRPPMPKRRLSYTYTGPLPYTGCMDADAHWPGSPRPFTNNSPWHQHQPLVSAHSVQHTTPRVQGSKPAKHGGSSLEKLLDELLPRSPSIRLSPPGSPASQVISLPESSPAPTPRQDKPKETPWRTRLPPRPPIPKWDM